MRWDHVVGWVSGQWMPIAGAGLDHGKVAVFVWRVERVGSDIKMPESRRALALPGKRVEARKGSDNRGRSSCKAHEHGTATSVWV